MSGPALNPPIPQEPFSTSDTSDLSSSDIERRLLLAVDDSEAGAGLKSTSQQLGQCNRMASQKSATAGLRASNSMDGAAALSKRWVFVR